MKGVKIITIVTLVVVVGVLGFVIYSHHKNKTAGSTGGTDTRSIDFNDVIE